MNQQRYSYSQVTDHGDFYELDQAVYEGEEQYLSMQRNVDDVFREERDEVQKLVGDLEKSVEEILEQGGDNL